MFPRFGDYIFAFWNTFGNFFREHGMSTDTFLILLLLSLPQQFRRNLAGHDYSIHEYTEIFFGAIRSYIRLVFT